MEPGQLLGRGDMQVVQANLHILAAA